MKRNRTIASSGQRVTTGPLNRPPSHQTPARLSLAFTPREENCMANWRRAWWPGGTWLFQPAAARQPAAGGADRAVASVGRQGATGSSLFHPCLGGAARPSAPHPLCPRATAIAPCAGAEQEPLLPRLAPDRAAQPDPVTPRGARHLATPLSGTSDPG